jgi:hypothetical protein
LLGGDARLSWKISLEAVKKISSEIPSCSECKIGNDKARWLVASWPWAGGGVRKMAKNHSLNRIRRRKTGGDNTHQDGAAIYVGDLILRDIQKNFSMLCECVVDVPGLIR